MENKLKERVCQYCKYMNIRVSQFEKKAGLSNGYFNQVSKKPSNSKLDAIAKAHPNLDIDWLCTGRGEMVKDNTSLSQPTPVAEVKPVAETSLVNYLERKVGDQDLLIRELYQQIGALEKELELARKGETAKGAGVSLSANAI